MMLYCLKMLLSWDEGTGICSEVDWLRKETKISSCLLRQIRKTGSWFTCCTKTSCNREWVKFNIDTACYFPLDCHHLDHFKKKSVVFITVFIKFWSKKDRTNIKIICKIRGKYLDLDEVGKVENYIIWNFIWELCGSLSSQHAASWGCRWIWPLDMEGSC